MKQGMEEYLKKYKDIDMVYCENDSEALGAINAIKQAGKKVGTDKLNLCTKKDSALQNPFCIACVILYDVCNLQGFLRISPEIICRNIPCYDILPNRQSLRYSCQSTQADVPHVPAGSAGHKRNR